MSSIKMEGKPQMILVPALCGARRVLEKCSLIPFYLS